MAHFLYINDDDNLRKVNIDELFENKQKKDLKQLSIFNKILNRINRRITLTGRTKNNARYVWFNIPEFIFGEPIYDKGDCIAYIVSKLEENGFFLRYIHPNTLFISWLHWVPSYVRTELKKKTGIIVNEYGEKIGLEEDPEEDEGKMTVSFKGPGTGIGSSNHTSKKEFDLKDTNQFMLKSSSNPKEDKLQPKKNYKPIQTYQPSGDLF